MLFNTSSNTNSRRKKINYLNYMVYIIFGIILAIFAIWLGRRFFSINNILNITRQTAMISIMSVAMTFVIASSNIDLSIGSIAALTSLVVGLVLHATGNVFFAIVTGLAVGGISGFISGWFVAAFGIPSFLVTLGMSSIIKGVAMWITNTATVPIANETFNQMFGLGTIFGVIPVLLIWTLVALVIGYFVLNQMPFGRRVLATGGNVIAAKYTGVKVKRITISVLVISGIAASIAGMLYAGRMSSGRYTFGEGDELNVIAAVVLGGTSMAGGTGSIIGAIIGSLLMGVISNGLIIGGLSVAQQMIIRGLIIILAVTLSSIGSRKVLNKN